MKKRILLATLAVLVGFTFMACTTTDTTTPTTGATTAALTSIAFAGADDITLDFNTPFNVFTGVTATGNNGVDYTADIIFTSTSAAIATDGTLDPTAVGIHSLRYQVTVGTIIAQRWRYITIKSPEQVEGQMLVNPDFAQGVAGWNDPSVVYVADGAALTLSADEGSLKAEVVSGSNVYTPRFGQMNVPFVMGKTYQVSFRAKSSVVKTINLQVGELLSGAPYFTDFKPGLNISKEIGTEWATYSYKFTMNLDNSRGGVLFELGTFNGLDIDATMWFDDIVIVESTPDADTIAPVFTGVKESVELAIFAEYLPAKGVTAFDAVDGDVTADIVITFKDKDDNAITAIDTSVPGTYYVIYTIEDEAGNIGQATTEVVVKSLHFSDENLVANPSFETALNETTPEWGVWSQNWGTAPVVTSAIDTVNGVYTVGIVGGGDAAWAIQLQTAAMNLVQGETYRVQFTASASVARNINVAVGWKDAQDVWTGFGRRDGFELTTEAKVYEFIFSVTPETHDVIMTFELGTQPGFADGTVTIYDAAINLAVEEVDPYDYSSTNLVSNPTFANALNVTTPEWGVWSQNWGNAPVVAAAIDTVAGVYNVGITNGGGEAVWAVQMQSGFITLEQGQTYRVRFTASASVARTMNLAIGWSNSENVFTQFGRINDLALTTEPTLYEYVFTVTEATHEVKLNFELGASDGFAEGVVTFHDVEVNERVEFSDVSMLPNGSFSTALNETTPEWSVWVQNWGAVPVVTAGIDTVNGVYNVASVGGGEAAWAIQLQSAFVTIETGKTYCVRFTVSASAARTMNLAIGWTNTETNAFTEFGRLSNIALTTESATFEYVFTVTQATHEVKIGFELGSSDGYVDSTVTFSDVALYENIKFQTTNMVANPSFNTALNETTPEWSVWVQNWGAMPVVTPAIDTVNGVYNVGIVGGGEAAWSVQLQSAYLTLETGKTYRVRFSASASVARTINLAVGWTDSVSNAFTEFGRINLVSLTDEAAVFEYIFTVTQATHEVKLNFELGTALAYADGTVTFYEVTLNEAIAE